MKKEDLQIFDRWAQTYDQNVHTAENSSDWMYRHYTEILRAVVNRLKDSHVEKKTGIVIDIGSGTGNLTTELVKEGYCVIGLEPSCKMRQKFKKKLPVAQVVAGEFLSIPLKNTSVDALVSSYAWHHLTGTEKISSIIEMKRVLKPKGLVIIADLMFENEKERKRIISVLKNSNKENIIADIESEYYADVSLLAQHFNLNGFTFESMRLTEFVWLIEAHLN